MNTKENSENSHNDIFGYYDSSATAQRTDTISDKEELKEGSESLKKSENIEQNRSLNSDIMFSEFYF